MQLANGIPLGIFGPQAVKPRVGGAHGFSPEEPGPNVPYGLLANPAYRTPGIDDGLPGAIPAPPPADAPRGPVSLMPLDMPLQKPVLPENRPGPEFVSMAPLPGVKPKTPGFFSSGGGWRDLLGAIGDALLTANGRPAMYMPLKLQRQKIAYQERQRQQQRQQDWEDWQRQWDYQVGHPKPSTAAPYRWERNDGSLMEMGADGQSHIAYDDPTPKMNFIPDGMGGGRWVEVPRSSSPMVTKDRPAIGAIMPDPRWGGGSGNATGGFR